MDSVTITNTLRTFTVATTNVVAHDDDGDTLTYDYQWLKNGVDLTGETGSTLNLGVQPTVTAATRSRFASRRPTA